MNPNFDAVGTQFVKLYYDTFDADRQQLLPLYVSVAVIVSCSFDMQLQELLE